MPISVELIRFWKLLFVTASSSILIFSSWLTVVSSSLTDCSSSLLVSSSSAADRSSSFVACSSSFDAFASSTWVSYLLDGGPKLRLQPLQLVFQLLRRFRRERARELHGRRRDRARIRRILFPEQDEEEAARGLFLVEDGPHAEVDSARLAVDRDLYTCDLHVHMVAARTEQRCPQFNPQLGPDQPHQVTREITAGDLQVLGGVLGHMHHLVLLGHND